MPRRIDLTRRARALARDAVRLSKINFAAPARASETAAAWPAPPHPAIAIDLPRGVKPSSRRRAAMSPWPSVLKPRECLPKMIVLTAPILRAAGSDFLTQAAARVL